MGRKILGWFGGILGFLVVLGIAMTPMEEQPEKPYVSNAVTVTTPVSITSSVPEEEPQTVVLPSEPVPSPTTEPVPSPEPNVSPTPEPTAVITLEQADYVLNTNSEKFHYPTCPSVGLMSEKNKQFFIGTRDEVIEQGFDPCQNCNP